MELGDCLGVRRLIVDNDEGHVWGWFGTHRKFDQAALRHYLGRCWPATVALALGEPESAVEGWRLTHRQACAASDLVRGGLGPGPTFYADVAVLAGVHADELLSASLRTIYLAPLASHPRGEMLCRTLRAYLAVGQNASAAAEMVGVERRTVANHLESVETCLGRVLADCLPGLELALELEQLSGPRDRGSSLRGKIVPAPEASEDKSHAGTTSGSKNA